MLAYCGDEKTSASLHVAYVTSKLTQLNGIEKRLPCWRTNDRLDFSCTTGIQD